MNSLLWAFAAASIAVPLEIAYRRSTDGFPLWAIFPAVLLSFFIYKTLHGGPTYLTALAVFNVVVLAMRAGASHFLLDEPISGANMLAAGFMGLAAGSGMIWSLWR